MIDLGADITPLKLTNSGFILYSAAGGRYRWSNGTGTLLGPAVSGDEVYPADLAEDGTVVGSETIPVNVSTLDAITGETFSTDPGTSSVLAKWLAGSGTAALSVLGGSVETWPSGHSVPLKHSRLCDNAAVATSGGHTYTLQNKAITDPSLPYWASSDLESEFYDLYEDGGEVGSGVGLKWYDTGHSSDYGYGFYAACVGNVASLRAMSR